MVESESLIAARRPMSGLANWATRPDATPNRARVAIALTVAYAVFVGTYLPINMFSIGRDAHVLFLPWEARIPFIPEFEFIYILGYVFPVAAVFKLPDIHRFRQLVTAFPLTLVVAYATYLLFPVYLERPVLEVDSLATFMLSIEYLDPSYNHFPSLHVATSWLVYFACRHGIRRHKLFLGTVIGISVSTIFVKQHYVVDVVWGVVLATAAWVIAARLPAAFAVTAVRGNGEPVR